MPSYIYRARDAAGRPVSGRIDADSERHAAELLRTQQMYVTEIQVNKDLRLAVRRQRPSGGKITAKDLAVFCRQLKTLVSAGIPIVAGLRAIQRQSPNRRLASALLSVIAELETGESLSRAFRRRGALFPPLLGNLVEAGEFGGVLEEVLDYMGLYFEKEDSLNQKVRSALTYPALVLLVSIGVVFFLLVVVLPSFARIFSEFGADLPWLTRRLLGMGQWLGRYWPLPVGALGLLVAGLSAYRRTPAGGLAVDRCLLRLPIVGALLSQRALARFARTLATLLAGGVPMLTALAVVERGVGNRVLATALRDAQVAVREGQGVARSLRASRVFPSLVLEMVAVGEETGNLEEILLKVAEFYERDLDRLTERLTGLLEPVLIVGLGLVVGGIVLAVVLPMFEVFTLFPM
ncbi:MAG: type II secretion system F family protein [Bacillota bacterium]